jgi:hypothetical protein
VESLGHCLDGTLAGPWMTVGAGTRRARAQRGRRVVPSVLARKIRENPGTSLDYFMVRKVIGSKAQPKASDINGDPRMTGPA